jgi:hypothetical protein
LFRGSLVEAGQEIEKNLVSVKRLSFAASSRILLRFAENLLRSWQGSQDGYKGVVGWVLTVHEI